jgi:phosphoribosyl-ATP pyrophosphohydrolase
MYRENIFQFIEGEKPILYLPTNKRMSSYIQSFLPEIGLNVIKNLGQMEFPLFFKEMMVVPSRAEKIPKIIEDFGTNPNTKMNVYGLTGDDLFDEYMLGLEDQPTPPTTKVLNTYDWFDKTAQFKRPALCLLTKKNEELPDKVKVAACEKYEKTVQKYLERSSNFQGKEFELKTFDGGIEEKVTKEDFDCCVDIVSSGNSYKKEGLELKEKVRFSDIVLIGPNPNRLGDLIMQDYNRILERDKNPKEGSYTTDLLSSKKKRRDKIISEAAEVFSAIEKGNGLESELADLIYAMNTIMVGENIDPQTIAMQIERRFK